jgi:zinc transporter ZupT
MNVIAAGAIASLVAGLVTGVGALSVLLPIDPSERTQGILLGLGGGIMLAATSFSGVADALALVRQQFWHAQTFQSSGLGEEVVKVPGVLFNTWSYLLCHAA